MSPNKYIVPDPRSAAMPETMVRPQWLNEQLFPLQLARRKQEQYLDPWLPEPLFAAEALEAVSLEWQIVAMITRFSLVSVTPEAGEQINM